MTETARDVLTLKHGGAAGGIAAAFHALFDAQLISGADYCLEISDFKNQLLNAKCVITGEGKLDAQSLNGKLPGVLSLLCQQYQIPIIGIAGSVVPPLPHFKHLYSLLDYSSDLSDAIQHPEKFLRQIAKDLKTVLLKL
jgi:glycerate kinase